VSPNVKEPLVIHPVLFAIFPIVFLFSHNVTTGSPNEIIRPIIIATSFTLLLWLLLIPLVKSSEKVGMIVSTFLFLFFSFGHFGDITRNWTAAEVGIGRLRYVLLLDAIIFAAVACSIVKTRRELHTITALLNGVAILLVGVSVAHAAYGIATRPHLYTASQINPGVVNKPGKCPDIYYIILDGYARADVLRDVYQLDNSQFLGYLRAKGFYVAEKSRSYYSQTYLSLASSLNLTYLDDVVQQVGAASDNRGPLAEMIQNSHVRSFLEGQGYVFVALSSGYRATEMPNADLYLAAPRSLAEFENALINTTPIPIFGAKLVNVVLGINVFNRWQFDSHRHRLLYIFNQLAEVAKTNSPKFVFAHILAPHPPFVFGEHGELVEPNRKFSFADGSHFIMKGGDREEYLTNYAAQLTFVNHKIKQAIDNIISNSREAPIIILQADHGPGSMLNWEDPDNTGLNERMSILNACYLPNSGRKDLYDEITPVNTFRLIFNRYFGADYEILADKSCFSTWTHPYEFIRLTGKTCDD